MMNQCAPPFEARGADARPRERVYRPNVDIYDESDEVVLLVDLPGTSPDSIEVDYEDGELSVRAKVERRQSTERSCLLREYEVGDYGRTFRVSEVVDPDRITARFSDGVLTLRLPKVQAAKQRRIEVASN